MIDVSKIIETLKALLDSEKRFTLISWVFFGVIIWYLYDDNINLNSKIALHEATYSEVLKKAQESCQEQLNLSRSKQQAQLDLFIEKSNIERDSTYRYFEGVIRSINKRVNKGLNEINELKDENTN